MATRTAQIIIDVDSKSLDQLNSEIQQLENNIKGLKIGTAAWNVENAKLGKLKTQLNEATREADKLQKVVEKVGSAEQIRAVAKLGAGLVGAFSAVNGTLDALGLSGNKTLDEITAKGVQLMQIFGGLNQVADLFSKDTLKGLSSLGSGFKGLLTTVKTASTGMKVALASTGIGLLVVGVGLLVTYWEDIVNLVTGANKKQEEYLNTLNAQAEKQRQYATSELENLNKQIDLWKEKWKYQKDYAQLAQNDLQLIISRQEVVEAEIKALLTRNDVIANQLSNNKKLTDIEKEKLETERLINKEKISGYNFDEEKYKLQREEANRYLGISKTIGNLNDKIKETSHTVAILNAQGDKQRKVYELQYQSLVDQITILNKLKETNGGLTEEEEEKLNILNEQTKVLNAQETIRLREEKLEKQRIKDTKEELEYQKQINIQLSDHLIKYNEELNLFDDKKTLNEQYKNSLDEQTTYITNQYDSVKKLVEQNALGLSVHEKNKKLLQEELRFYTLLQETEQKKLLVSNQELETSIDINKSKIDELDYAYDLETSEIERNKVLIERAKLKTADAKTEQEKLDIVTEIAGYETTINNLMVEQSNKLTESNQLKNQNILLTDKIVSNNKKIVKSSDDVVQKDKEITSELEKQVKLYKKLQDFTSKYADEIDAVTEAISNTVELTATLYDERAKRFKQEADEAQGRLDELAKSQEDVQSKLLGYENELKDANGERYDELLSRISQQQDAQASLQSQIDADTEKQKKAERERQLAERKAAQWRKAQAIIDATIAGALAVIKALPNIFLSIAVGIAAAAGVATIAVQKVPDASTFKSGGFTRKGSSDNQVAGTVHANEYVVPARVLRSKEGQQHVAALETMRGGFKAGGYTTPSSNPNMSGGIDYDMMTMSFINAISYLPNPQVSLVNISNGVREVELTKNNSGLSR